MFIINNLNLSNHLFVLIILLLISVFLLFIGGDLLCKGAEIISGKLNINQSIIGLTIISAATSMPEFGTSLYSIMSGNTDIGVGNIVGSNIANLSLIIGITALISPFYIENDNLKEDRLFLLLITIVFIGFSLYQYKIDRIKGLILFLLLILYLYKKIINLKKETINNYKNNKALSLGILYIIVSTILLLLGAKLTTICAIKIAFLMKIKQIFIGLTLVAIGTSLPELSASVVSSLKNKHLISVGNIIGSNIFNITFIIGIISIITPFKINYKICYLENFIMLLLTINIYKNMYFSRLKGLILIILYFIIIFISSST